MLFFDLYCFMQYIAKNKTDRLPNTKHMNKKYAIFFPFSSYFIEPGHKIVLKKENKKPVKSNRGMVVDHSRSPVLKILNKRRM